MGLFGGSKEIIVSSTVYNLAGDEENRPNFIKNTIYGAVISPHNPFLGETIVRNLLIGPGMNQRHFFNWANRQNYPGLPIFQVVRESEVDEAIVAPFIPIPGSPSGLVVDVQTANVTSGSYEFLVEEYILANIPEEFNTNYVTSFDEDTGDITIQLEGGGSVIFDAQGFTKDKEYVTATYYLSVPSDVRDLVTGGTTVADLNAPDTTGYTQDSSVTTGIVNYAMTYDERVITTYTGVPTLPSDTDETTEDLNDDVDFDGITEEWSKITYEGGDGNTSQTLSIEHFLHFDEYRQIYTDDTLVSTVVNEDTPASGQTETIVTRRIGDHLRPVFDHRIDTQDTVIDEVFFGAQVWWYEVGTGESTLDDLREILAVTATESEYFPYMPIRLKNVSINDPVYDDITGSGLYELTNRAYRRASGGGERFSKLVDQIEDNASIEDIDFAFTHHGVAINVIEPACRRYMYKWFKSVIIHQTTGATYMDDYKILADAYVADYATLNAWIFDQGDSGRPLYGTAQPPVPKLKDLKKTRVKLACADPQLKNLDMRITWININETTDISGAPTNPDTAVAGVKGDIWIQEGTDVVWTVTKGVFPDIYNNTHTVEKLEMIWMTSDNTYDKLDLYGLIHKNFVYGGEAVKTRGKRALTEITDEPTGFLIPLHYDTMKDLGLVNATQMATANTFVIFNSFEVVKQRWYEGFLGMIIIIIVIIILAIIFAPAGAGAAGGGSGILGANAAVGAAIGFTGTAAIVAGAIANALVAIAIAQIVTVASTTVFGEKWGPVIAAVINLVITVGASSGFNFQNVGELLTAENVLKISSAVANGYEGYVQGAIAEMNDELIEDQKKFETEAKKIEKMLRELRGGNDLQFDPLQLTDSIRGNDLGITGIGYITETLDQFIHRTTMTGSDIVEISLSMIDSYTELSLQLPS